MLLLLLLLPVPEAAGVCLRCPSSRPLPFRILHSSAAPFKSSSPTPSTLIPTLLCIITCREGRRSARADAEQQASGSRRAASPPAAMGAEEALDLGLRRGRSARGRGDYSYAEEDYNDDDQGGETRGALLSFDASAALLFSSAPSLFPMLFLPSPLFPVPPPPLPPIKPLPPPSSIRFPLLPPLFPQPPPLSSCYLNPPPPLSVLLFLLLSLQRTLISLLAYSLNPDLLLRTLVGGSRV